MEGMLRVDTSSTFPGSPTNSFLADEVASTCPLLTPSPPTNALVNPLPEPENGNFILPQELACKLHDVRDDNTEGGDSASSSSSALAEPACTQLLSGHNPYLHITKNEEAASEETGGKTQNLQMTFRNPPENYFFMKWNWPLIRKLTAWLLLSCLVGMMGIVVAMVWTMPKTCNPPTEWYQGSLMYEIFPASFSDSNDDGVGDLRGIASRIDYIDSLGVRAVRLISIYPCHGSYPENYKNVTSIMEVAPKLGNLTDFTTLVTALHAQNMYLILDMPTWPFVKLLTSGTVEVLESNSTENQPAYEFLRTSSFVNDPIAEAMSFWTKLGVDGFYLKGIEYLSEDPNFTATLKRWRKLLGPDRALIVHQDLIDGIPPELLNIVLNNVDLVDIRLEVGTGVEWMSDQIESVFNSTLFTRAGSPWVHWSLANEDIPRLANMLPSSNATLGASLLQLMLPGTPCIFYGDEIGLQQVSDPHEDRKDLMHLHQLAPMVWDYRYKPFTRKEILPWMYSQPTPVNFAQFDVISKMAALRSTSPSIYVNALSKDGCNKANAEIKYKKNDLLVIQRWYPRRKSYVVVCNLGCVHISADLSTLLYSGEIVVGPTAQFKPESVSFKDISLWPRESVIVLLD